MNILNTIIDNVINALDFIQIKRQEHYWNNFFAANLAKLGHIKLSTKQINEIKDLYSSYCKVSLVQHKFYTKATGSFQHNYMPDSLYYAYIDPFFNNWKMAKYMDHKGLYRNMFPGAKQPKLIVSRMNGFWYDENAKLINKFIALEKIKNTPTCFVKQATDSEGGHGITFIDNTNTTDIQIKSIVDGIKVDLIVQEGLIQSKQLSEINESSVNTVRLLTFLKRDGSVNIYSVILRMGINGSKVDNASSGGITIGIKEDGRLKPYAYNTNGVRYDYHPTSGVKFDNYVIPNYDKVKILVKEQAQHFPHYRLVSWDIAIDNNEEPVIIEANLHFGEIDFHQLNNGPLFGEDTEIILKEVFNREKQPN